MLDRQEFPIWLWVPFLTLLACAPGSTKLAGLGWLLIVVAGLVCMVRMAIARDRFCTPEDPEILQAARTWLMFCLLAFFFKFVGVLYWSDPIGTRHFDFRMLLSALAIHFFVARVTIGRARSSALVVSLMVASIVGLTFSYLHVSFDVDTPSNRINWAGGQVMLSWVLLSAAASDALAARWRGLAAVGFLVFWMAVLLSGARSAYLSLPWVVAAGMMLLMSKTGPATRGRWLLLLTMGAAALTVILTLTSPKVVQVPMSRIVLAVEQARVALGWETDQPRDVNTPVGSRLYMWQRSLEVIKESPWIGYGREQRIAFIKEWGREADAHIVKDQFHLHSEYINGMVDHGVVGLASTASYMIGLLVVAWRLRRRHGLMSLAVAGVAFTHITMSITNANSQTNNYSVVFGLAMMLIFLFRFGGIRPKESSAQDAPLPAFPWR